MTTYIVSFWAQRGNHPAHYGAERVSCTDSATRAMLLQQAIRQWEQANPSRSKLHRNQYLLIQCVEVKDDRT